MSTNENTIKVRKFKNPVIAARSWLHKCESLYKQAIKSGIGIEKAEENYMQAKYNYNLLRG